MGRFIFCFHAVLKSKTGPILLCYTVVYGCLNKVSYMMSLIWFCRLFHEHTCMWTCFWQLASLFTQTVECDSRWRHWKLCPLAQLCVTSNRYIVHCILKFYELHELMGSYQWKLSDKIVCVRAESVNLEGDCRNYFCI